MRPSPAFSAVVLALTAACSLAADWPQWRGPSFNGATTETDLPATFSRTENVQWVAAMPGRSGATPIVWGDRVFITSADAQTQDLLAICIDARTGRELWRRKTGKDSHPGRLNNMASPSPVTDGRTVWFHYGTQALVAFGLDGKPLWQRDLRKDHGHNAHMFGYSSSPLLFRGKLYITAIRNKRQNRYRRGPAAPAEDYLLAIDPDTGRDLWKVDRLTDARDEAQEAYSSAIPFERGGRAEILVFGADYLTAHDPDTGKEIWRWATYNPHRIHHWRIVPSPVVAGDVVVVVGPKHSTMFAIRPGGKGRIGKGHVAWTLDTAIPDASTPLYYQGRLYVLEDDRRILSCVDPTTGVVKWQERLGGRGVIRASLTGADGKLYCFYENAEAVVLAAGDTFKVLHRIILTDQRRSYSRSTIVAAQRRLFIRTDESLFCIGK